MLGISNGFWGVIFLLSTGIENSPYMLFTKSMRTYYMVEAINIQIFIHDFPQTINPENNCKIASYDCINQS